jgi:hypothetical protein
VVGYFLDTQRGQPFSGHSFIDPTKEEEKASSPDSQSDNDEKPQPDAESRTKEDASAASCSLFDGHAVSVGIGQAFNGQAVVPAATVAIGGEVRTAKGRR